MPQLVQDPCWYILHQLVLDATDVVHQDVHMHQTEHVTVAQAAHILGESRWTVQRRIRSGQLKAYQLGDGGTAPYVIDRAAVEQLARLLVAL